MSVHVQRLAESSREQLREHFLQLGREDVRLRFGSPLSPELISAYVDRIDFDTDAVFGIHDEELRLVAVAHVAFSEDLAELGVSVLARNRGAGFGSTLFNRAVEHARNRFHRRLFVHCLAENAAMMHIARKSAMTICIDTGEAEAFLQLPPADAVSMTGEFVDQRLALFDYALKARVAALKRYTDTLGEAEG
jgi:GNAT superfamily N-acetyltransferase